METTNELEEQRQYLSFEIAGDEYALGILRVKEIIEYDTVTRVPATPPWIRGVINLRGSVVPVIDLAVKFGLADRQVTKRTCIVIVEVNLEGSQTVMGLIVDGVSQVINLQPEEIEAAPRFGTRVQANFLQGLGKLGKKFVLILNIDDRLLSMDEVAAATTAASGALPSPAASAPSHGCSASA